MYENFPLQNQGTEGSCSLVKEIDNEIMMSAMTMEHENGMDIGCTVENMKPYILSDLCLVQHEHSIPSVKECCHSDSQR